MWYFDTVNWTWFVRTPLIIRQWYIHDVWAPKMRQAMLWTSGGIVLRLVYASLGLNVRNGTITLMSVFPSCQWSIVNEMLIYSHNKELCFFTWCLYNTVFVRSFRVWTNNLYCLIWNLFFVFCNSAKAKNILTRKNKDYVHGIWQYRVLSIKIYLN